MRMSCTLGACSAEPREYSAAVRAVSRLTGISSWTVFVDSQQTSTRAAGNSCCAFLATKFPTLQQAVDAMITLQRELPTVNLELFVAPGGRNDQGDGIGAYDRLGVINRALSAYIDNDKFTVALLVDAQNVNRCL
jgi:hypothetical protein